MNDIIVGVVDNGSFKFPIEFNMFGNKQSIPDAVFDTGCSHSLISVRNLNIGDRDIEELKEEAFYDVNVTLALGRGIESKDIDTKQLNRDIKKINRWKEQLLAKKCSNERAKELILEHITEDMIERISKGKRLIRYEYMASDYKINGVTIGDVKVRLSFELGKVNLIGMHIIRELYTKIFSEGGNIYLLAEKNSPLADSELDIAIDELREQLGTLDSSILRSNYISTCCNQNN